MTSALVLDELDLDLPATCLLVRLRLVVIVVVVLAALARVGVVDEAIIVGDGALVELVAGALVGHVRRRDVGRLGHWLLRGRRRLLLGVVGTGIGRRNVLAGNGLGWLASAKGHELVKSKTGPGRVGRTSTPNSDAYRKWRRGLRGK